MNTDYFLRSKSYEDLSLCSDRRFRITRSRSTPRFTLTQPAIDALPDELLCYIFSFLNMKSLGKAMFVCKRWNKCALDPQALQKVVLRDFVFSNEDWVRYLGKEVSFGEGGKQPSVTEILDECTKFGRVFPDVPLEKRLMLIQIPKGLTLNMIGRIFRENFPKEFSRGVYFEAYCDQYLIENPYDFPQDRSYWVYVSRYILPRINSNHITVLESLDLQYACLTGYKAPSLFEAVSSALAFKLKSKVDFIFGRTFGINTACRDILYDWHALVGVHDSQGLQLGYQGGREPSQQEGVLGAKEVATPIQSSPEASK